MQYISLDGQTQCMNTPTSFHVLASGSLSLKTPYIHTALRIARKFSLASGPVNQLSKSICKRWLCSILCCTPWNASQGCIPNTALPLSYSFLPAPFLCLPWISFYWRSWFWLDCEKMSSSYCTHQRHQKHWLVNALLAITLHITACTMTDHPWPLEEISLVSHLY